MALESDPNDSVADAWINTAVPKRVSQAEQYDFIVTGYDNYYTDAGKFDEDALYEDIKIFAISAFNQMPERAVQKEPLHADPWSLTTVATLAAFVVDKHPSYDKMTDGLAMPNKQLTEDVKSLWQRHLHLQLGQFLENGETSVIRTIADYIYRRRRQDPLGPPEGWAVTGIKTVEAYDEPAVEIPFEHWNRQILVRNGQGEIRTYLHDGNAYVPLSDLRSKLLKMTDVAFETHYQTHQDMLDSDQCQSLLSEMKSVYDRIDEMLLTQDVDRLYEREEKIPDVLKVTMNAIASSDAPYARFHEPLSAKELVPLVKAHSPNPSYEEAIDVTGELTAEKLSKKLTPHSESKFLSIDKSGQVYSFTMNPPKQKGKQIGDKEEDYPETTEQDFRSPLAEQLPDSYSPTYLTEGSVGHRRHGLDDPEATVLRTIIDSYNGYNNYPLELPMNRNITNKFDDVSVISLEERGFLKRHKLAKRGAWFTPTKDAQKAVGRTCRAGINKGDPGEEMPHRVGNHLIKLYLYQLSNVSSVALYEAVGDAGKRLDAIAYDIDLSPLHAVEVESGELTPDGNSKTWGTNNGEAIANDFRKLAELDGESWWITRNQKVAHQVLKHLRRKGLLDVDKIVKGPMKRKREQIAELDVEAIDHLYSFQEIWNALENGEFIHD